jgi:hypothetical protein
MPKIFRDLVQGSADWMRARAGLPTASEFCELLTPEFKPREGETPKKYLATKLAERWLGGPLPGFSSWATEQGTLREDEAIPFFEMTRNVDVQRVGFVTTDDGRAGCSPDGLIGEDNGLEVKCPEPTQHVSYLLSGELPKQYRCQVYGSMWITGRPRWTFLSYAVGFPKLVLTVEWDQGIIERIQETVDEFCARLDKAFERLCEINGGPPR